MEMATKYSFVTLDDPLGNSTSANGINNAGQIVGTYFANNVSHGFFYANGAYANVTTSGPQPGMQKNLQSVNTAEGINNTGLRVGSGIFSQTTLIPTQPTNPSPNQPTPAFAILSQQPDGYITDANNQWTPLVFPGSTTQTFAYDLNNLGQVVGYYTNNSNPHGFVYSNGSYTSFDDPLGINGGAGTWGQGINDSGQVVGYFQDSLHHTHSFQHSLAPGGGFSPLDDPLGANGTFATDINNLGQVVGYYVDAKVPLAPS